MNAQVLVGAGAICVTILLTALATASKWGAIAVQLEALRAAVSELKADMKESARAQGARIGKGEDAVAVLFDRLARIEGRDAERDTSGMVRR